MIKIAEARFQQKAVARGKWLYDSLIEKGVIINAVNYDYWYELEKSDGLDMSDEEPELNHNGEMYMIMWTDSRYKRQESFTVGTLELDSTKALAEATINQLIMWI